MPEIATNLQEALDDWPQYGPTLEAVYTELNEGLLDDTFTFSANLCAAPLPRAFGSCRFHTVKNILATGQDRLPLEPPAETAPTPTHANIRGADYYAATTTGEDPC